MRGAAARRRGRRHAPEKEGKRGVDAELFAQQALVKDGVVVDGRKWIVLRPAQIDA